MYFHFFNDDLTESFRSIYFPSNEMPSPLPPMLGNGQSSVACHDEIANPGNDSVLYDRFELIKNYFLGWDKNDPRFQVGINGKKKIDRLIEAEIYEQYGITENVNLFSELYWSLPNNNQSKILTNIMIPFIDSKSGRAFCPKNVNFNSSNPIMNVLGKYISETEGIYLAEKEGEIVNNGNQYKTVYGNMFIRENLLIQYGFYIENGLKIKATSSDLHVKSIYFYWPISKQVDPLLQGNRKLFTVRQMGETNEFRMNKYIKTSDKRFGCIPTNDIEW